MEDLIKNLKKKLSADSLVEMMKDAKVIDNKSIREEDVRKTLETIDTNNLIDVDELAMKLNEITEQAKAKKEQEAKAKKSSTILEKAMSGFGGASILSKSPEPEVEKKEYDYPDNVTGFLD